jgi:light-regulated signal transduction histidine kinase (bacteriophytochrome)
MRSSGTSPIEPAPKLCFGTRTIRRAARARGSTAALLRKIDGLESFAYMAAHDLQEPLRMVAGYTRLLSERYGDRLDPPAAEFLAFALEGSRRMQEMVDGLLLLACHPDEDRRLRTNSGEAVEAALANLCLAIEESHARVRVGKLPEVLADPAQLVRIFQNLIGNAIQHRSSPTPEISVECDDRARDWLFRVADNGRGFRGRLHFGLGLEICRRNLERHKGRLWVSSRGSGAVACFTLAKS